jgi:hypothetical protein
MEIPQYTNKSELYKFLRENKNFLINTKKSQIKHSEGCSFEIVSNVNKAIAMLPEDTDEVIYRQLVINTSNLMDSHDDVHIGNIWTKSINENSDRVIFFQEHQQELEKIISDGNDLKIFVKQIPFLELGYNSDILTDALIFDTSIRKDRNSFMFEQYKKGFVKQHSVGMQYVKIFLAMDSDDPYDAAEKEAWNKYYPQIANKERADEKGYFWAVTEAKLIEGSAVALGSNPITPTLSNNKSFETLQNEIELLKSQIALLQPIVKEPLQENNILNEFYKHLKIN